MPVLRKRETVRLQGSFQPVTARGNPMLEVNGQNASNLARMAADYARGMVVEAEETAKALAKAAVFNTGPNGVPQLPDNLAARMGRAARRTYDAAMEDRFVHHMTTSVKARLAEIQNRNLYDPEAYIAESEAALAEMAGEVPEQFQGAFQEAAAGMLVDGAASVGYRAAQIAEEEKRGTVDTMITDASASIIESIRIEDDAKADAQLDELFDLIEMQPASVMTRAQKDAAKDKVFYDVGLARLITAGDLENASPDQLTDIYTRLVAGNDPELAALFTRPGTDTPDPDMMVRAGQHIMQLMGKANERAAAEKEGRRLEMRVGEVMGGYASGSKEDKDVLDMGLSGSLKLRDKTGNIRTIAPEDWLYADEQTQADMLLAVKEAGFVPTSLEQMFRKLSKSSDPEMLWRGALLYRDLREQPTADGTTVDLTGIVDERLTTLFTLAEDLHGGGEPGQESIQAAVDKMIALEDDRWTPQDFAARLQSERSWVSQWVKGAITTENVDQTVTDLVRKSVFEENDIEARAEEQQQAERVFKLHLETGMTPEKALEATRQSFTGRYVESKASPGRRVWWAPEKQFAAPPARTLMDALGKVLIAVGAEDMALTEWLLEAPNGVVPNFLFTYEVNKGADWARAEPWELIADTEIRRLMIANGIKMEDLRQGETQVGGTERFIKAGRDYELRLDGVGPKGRPIYRVFMIDTLGNRVQLRGRLDMSAEFDKLSALADEARLFEQENARRARRGEAAVEWATEGDPNADFFEELRKGQTK